MKSKKIKKFPKIQKDLKFFLESEEGKIVERDAVKLAAAVIASGVFLSGVMTPTDNAYGQHCRETVTHTRHQSHSRGSWCW